MEHTSTPWSVCGKPPNDRWYEDITIGSADDTRIADVCCLDKNYKANAQFIVKACNAHDELVEIVKGWRAVVNEKALIKCEPGEEKFVADLVHKQADLLTKLEATP